MDSDDLQYDEMVGSINMDTEKLLKNQGQIVTKWFNVFGAPLGQSDSKARTQMNENPDFATTFKGRVLMQIEAQKSDKPVQKICYADDTITQSEVVEHYK